MIIAGGILLILMASLSKKEQTRQERTCRILIGVFFLITGIARDLIDAHLVSTSFAIYLKIIANISFGIALGIILTLRIFGVWKFGNKN